MPREPVIESFVVEDYKNKKLTDFISFYCLPSKVLKHVSHSEVKAAYSFYNIALTTPMSHLVKDVMILAK